jgi:hypothetical protein
VGKCGLLEERKSAREVNPMSSRRKENRRLKRAIARLGDWFAARDFWDDHIVEAVEGDGTTDIKLRFSRREYEAALRQARTERGIAQNIVQS